MEQYRHGGNSAAGDLRGEEDATRFSEYTEEVYRQSESVVSIRTRRFSGRIISIALGNSPTSPGSEL